MSLDPVDRLIDFAESNPAHPAVVESERTVTYEEFVLMSQSMAAAMMARGDRPRVLIHLPQCAEAYAAMFGALMAGGTYAPTNVTAPADRQRMVLERFVPDVVVSATRWIDALMLDPSDAAIVDIDHVQSVQQNLASDVADLAYVMFTSGSTGIPKGVMIPRAGLSHYTSWALDAMQVTPDDRWSQHPNIGFDLSVLDIYGALCGGATLYPLQSRGDRLQPGEAIRRNQLTIWNSVPSVIDLILRGKQMTPDYLGSLRLFTFCGEPLLQSHLEAIFAARPDVLVHNTYGPTEATVSFTLVKLNAENYAPACRQSVALGDPIPGMHLWLEDGSTPDEGEIVIGGPQVALGYWSDEEQTAAAFGNRSVGEKSYATYRTGDWAIRQDGHLFFDGRIDRQVKIHGHRLELGEIDAALRSCGAAAACTVLWHGSLHSFVECENSSELPALLRAVAKRLPNYAVPAQLHPIDHLPRNANDKIDSLALTEALEATDGTLGNDRQDAAQ